MNKADFTAMQRQLTPSPQARAALEARLESVSPKRRPSRWKYGLLAACEAGADAQAARMIEQVRAELPLPPEKKARPAVRAAHKASYREAVIKDCDDIMRRIDRLKKKKTDKIREIDRAADSRRDTVLAHVDRLISELSRFRRQISGDEGRWPEKDM